MNNVTDREIQPEVAGNVDIVHSLEFAIEQVSIATEKCRTSHDFADAAKACHTTRDVWLIIVEQERREPGCVSHDLITRARVNIVAAIGIVGEIGKSSENSVRIRRLLDEFVGSMTLRDCLLEKLKSKGIHEVDSLLITQRLSPETDWVGVI